jgi:hypothetical protein
MEEGRVSKLDEALAEAIATAGAAFTASTDHATIKTSTDKLSAVLKEWNAKYQAVQRAVGGMIDAVRRGCDHKGASRGYNERDGSWMAPCPHCGKSE